MSVPDVWNTGRVGLSISGHLSGDDVLTSNQLRGLAAAAESVARAVARDEAERVQEARAALHLGYARAVEDAFTAHEAAKGER